jgi:hypothetical protein
MGTLATMLAGRKISTSGRRYRAEVEGDIEEVEGILRITQIRVRYTLSATADRAGDVSECFERYLERCPAAMSVRGAIEIAHDIALVPEGVEI